MDYLSLVGQDPLGRLLRSELGAQGVSTEGVLPLLKETPQSTILYDSFGRRQIHVDSKDIQEGPYPIEEAQEALSQCDLVCCPTSTSLDRS